MNELKIVESINNFGHFSFLDTSSYWASDLTVLLLIWLCISIIILVINKKNGRFIILTFILAFFIHLIFTDFVFHNLFFRLRPYLVSDFINPIESLYSSSSFPSGHMTSMTALSTILIYYYRKLWPAALIFILIVAFTRLHNGMHYPSDVVAGIFFGLLYGMLAIFITNKYLLPILKK